MKYTKEYMRIISQNKTNTPVKEVKKVENAVNEVKKYEKTPVNENKRQTIMIDIETNKPVEKENTIFNETRARKPTEKQERTKEYTRANLKYLINKDPTCITETHIRKCFMKLFGNEPEKMI
jgi:hypothetical protein